MTADHGSEPDWIVVVDRTLSKFGRVDICVPNAGVHSAIPTVDMPLEEFRRINRINLKGPFLGLKHGVAAMRKHGEGGSVILISSVAGKVGLPAHVHYCSSKGGVRLMAKAAALELGPENIRVNSIHPGAIKTRMTAFADEEATAKGIPLGRMGEPMDIAQAALFLASPRGRFITGAELVVDGGWIVP
jgi:NAD(P)-dependent dehydrogenase (short-subunit alcohol dehydrogenase family)